MADLRAWGQALATAAPAMDGVEAHQRIATVDVRQASETAKVATSHLAVSRRRLLRLRHPQHPALNLHNSV
jgi:hypothetical protein